MESLKSEIAAVAARMVVEEGLDFGAAKRRAVKQMGLSGRTALPANEEIEDEVMAYIALFCADTQPGELSALRRLALVWMERLSAFKPYLGGQCGMAPLPVYQIFTCSCFVMTVNRRRSR